MHIRPLPVPRKLITAMLTILVTAALLLTAACEPSSEIATMLTQLPSTLTPRATRPKPTATQTPRPTATLAPNQISGPVSAYPTSTQLPGTAEACPTHRYDVTIPAFDDPQSFIGKHYDELNPPTGVTWLSSRLMNGDQLRFSRIKIQEREIYWIQKLVCRDREGKAYYQIVDVLTLPPVSSAKHQVLTELCFQDNQPVPYAVAYGTYDPNRPPETVNNQLTGWPLTIQRAYQMSGRFIPLNPEGLTCVIPEKS